MSFDLGKILQSKQALRRNLSSLPIAEKLKLLDVMREPELQIRESATQAGIGILREETNPYRVKKAAD